MIESDQAALEVFHCFIAFSEVLDRLKRNFLHPLAIDCAAGSVLI